MKLLVGSVYGPSERNETWYKLQLEFLDRTTPNYQHAVFLSGADRNLFHRSLILGEVENEWKPIVVEGKKENFCPHMKGMQTIVDCFHKGNYDHCLILDSDCFPIREGWLDLLLNKMGEKFMYAAPVRTENLDTFPHPSAFFIKTICGVNFQPTRWVKNLIGEKMLDNGSCIPMDDTFPLMRSNRYNPHPIFGGIYYDLFYHHCCGSRTDGAQTRATKSGYFEHYAINHDLIEEMLFNSLKKDPIAYLKKLKCTVAI